MKACSAAASGGSMAGLVSALRRLPGLCPPFSSLLEHLTAACQPHVVPVSMQLSRVGH